MEKSIVKTIIEKLTENVDVLFFIVGALFAILNIAGGVSYKNAFIIPGEWQWAGIAIGCVLMVVGILRPLVLPRSLDPYGIEITEPSKGESVDRTTVKGKIAKRLPKNHQLWVLRIYRDGEFVPLRRAEIEWRKGIWDAPDCDIGGSVSGDKRILGVYAVSPSGVAVIEAFRTASDRHYEIIDRHVPKNTPDTHLKPIMSRIREMEELMVECTRVEVKKK